MACRCRALIWPNARDQFLDFDTPRPFFSRCCPILKLIECPRPIQMPGGCRRSTPRLFMLLLDYRYSMRTSPRRTFRLFRPLLAYQYILRTSFRHPSSRAWKSAAKSGQTPGRQHIKNTIVTSCNVRPHPVQDDPMGSFCGWCHCPGRWHYHSCPWLHQTFIKNDHF